MTKIFCNELPNIPFIERPANCKDTVWRHPANPIIKRHGNIGAHNICNSAVIPFKGKFAGVFRIEFGDRVPFLHRGFSDDGINWDIDPEPIKFTGFTDFQDYGYDPRLTELEGKIYITWCNGLKWEPTIGVAWTDDFETFNQLENAFLPCNRNGVLFPRKINGEYKMLSRPSDPAHTPFGNIYISSSHDLVYWGKHREIMRPTSGWQRMKIGAGPAPLETDKGWLLFYHGVIQSCAGMLYSMGAALLDRDNPEKVIARSRKLLMTPIENYEQCGDVPNVVFPCGMLADSKTGRLAIYYGCADTYVGIAFAYADEVIDRIIKESE